MNNTVNKILQKIKKEKKVQAIYLFGSHGTDREMPLSDIDICFFTEPLSFKELLYLKSFGDAKIDISIFDNLPAPIKVEVFKGKSLYVKNKRIIAEKFASSYRHYQDFNKYRERYEYYFTKKCEKLI